MSGHFDTSIIIICTIIVLINILYVSICDTQANICFNSMFYHVFCFILQLFLKCCCWRHLGHMLHDKHWLTNKKMHLWWFSVNILVLIGKSLGFPTTSRHQEFVYCFSCDIRLLVREYLWWQKLQTELISTPIRINCRPRMIDGARCCMWIVDMFMLSPHWPHSGHLMSELHSSWVIIFNWREWSINEYSLLVITSKAGL